MGRGHDQARPGHNLLQDRCLSRGEAKMASKGSAMRSGNRSKWWPWDGWGESLHWMNCSTTTALDVRISEFCHLPANLSQSWREKDRLASANFDEKGETALLKGFLFFWTRKNILRTGKTHIRYSHAPLLLLKEPLLYARHHSTQFQNSHNRVLVQPLLQVCLGV